LAVFVFVQGLLQVQVVLAGEPRILRIDRIAVGAMAGEAGGRFGLALLDAAGGGRGGAGKGQDQAEGQQHGCALHAGFPGAHWARLDR
jgi:hypothetical protein